MEFAFRSRPTTAAADDEENGRPRRFPDPPPSQPHGHGGASISGVDAALLTRRQELMLELHKGFIHQDIILRELMETDRAMGLTADSHNPVPALPRSQDYWPSRTPSDPPLEAPLTAVRAPPWYPHVELSPRAPEQTRPGNDAEQHQEVRSSGVTTHPFNGYFEPYHSPSKQSPGRASINQMRPSSGHQQAVVWEKIGVEDIRNMQPLQIKNPSTEGRKPIDSAIEDSIKKPMQQRLQYKLADQENAAYNEQKSTDFNEPTPEGTSAGVKRKLSAPSSPVKKQKPLGQWSCTLCQANTVSQQQLEEHLAGNRHRSNVAALQQALRSGIIDPTMGATPAGSRAVVTNARQDGKEELPENRWTCTLCQAKCNSESDYHSHLGGRRHRENEEARRARLYCAVCDLQCTSEKMLASHLGGRRHRERLEGSD